MSRRKGVTAEEKRTRLLELFYEKKDVFQLKELEKIAPKEKGIVSQSVKDVLQSLVDDGLVDTDKIGTSVYFWAFPSKAGNIRKEKLLEIKTKTAEGNKRLSRLEQQVSEAKVGREETEERSKILSSLKLKEADMARLQTEIQKYRDCDPVVLKEIGKQAIVAKDSANRWTDNVLSIKSWCKKKFYIEESRLNKQFNIPEDFDYID